jgi:hypothetical protein
MGIQPGIDPRRTRRSVSAGGLWIKSARNLRSALYASLDWLPSLVGGGLAGCGFCLVWYRLRRLERLYRTVWLGDEGSQDAPRCRVCRRWLFAETLAAFKRLDDDNKRDYCAGCGGYNGPEPKDDDDPPPIPVAVEDAQTQKIVVVSDEPAPSPPKLVVVREDDPPPPVPIAIPNPAPTLLRMGTPHAEHCDCDVCLLNRRIAVDEAQAQTLGMIDDLAFLRQGLKTLRLTIDDEVDGMTRRIAKRLGDGT